MRVNIPVAWLDEIQPVLQDLVADKVASRISQKDFTLWGEDAESESKIRLGWVSSATDSISLIPQITKVREELASKGITRIVLCGMGGSSLAPEVITKRYGVDLVVLDSTAPDQVGQVVREQLENTAVVVSSKSGSTVETDSQKRIFEEAFTSAGIDKTERIIIVTDPGSPMEQAALADGYRVFNADPTVGGRYSALTAFGLVPSGLAGVAIDELLIQAQAAATELSIDSTENPGLILGAVLARLGSPSGYRDKVGIVSDSQTLPDFADWAEQLIAESTGKEEKGILPIVLQADSFELSAELSDVVLVSVSEKESFRAATEALVTGTIAEQFLLWEYATAVASRLIQVNPFDQPDVESAKIAARGMLAEKSKSKPPLFTDGGVKVLAEGLNLEGSTTLEQALELLLSEVGEQSYVAVHAYLNREAQLPSEKLRNLLAEKLARPVTFGWGPRFLHSTGQYHKGGPRTGVYLQLTSQTENDIAVPGREFSFGELIASQAAGDAKVLADLGRPVLTLVLGDVQKDFDRVISIIEGCK